MKNKIILIVAALCLIVVTVVITIALVQRNGNITPLITQTIYGDIVTISVSGTVQRRVVEIRIEEAGRMGTITLTQQRRVVRQRSNDTLPPLPRQVMRHYSDSLKIYTIGAMIVVYERGGQRHYI